MGLWCKSASCGQNTYDINKHDPDKNNVLQLPKYFFFLSWVHEIQEKKIFRSDLDENEKIDHQIFSYLPLRASVQSSICFKIAQMSHMLHIAMIFITVKSTYYFLHSFREKKTIHLPQLPNAQGNVYRLFVSSDQLSKHSKIFILQWEETETNPKAETDKGMFATNQRLKKLSSAKTNVICVWKHWDRLKDFHIVGFGLLLRFVQKH